MTEAGTVAAAEPHRSLAPDRRPIERRSAPGLRVVSKRQPTAEEWNALRFAWRVCAHVKSNTIIFTRRDRTLAVGAGQMSRVDAVKVAVMKAAGAAVARRAASPHRMRSSRSATASTPSPTPARPRWFSPGDRSRMPRSSPPPTSADWRWSSPDAAISATSRGMRGSPAPERGAGHAGPVLWGLLLCAVRCISSRSATPPSGTPTRRSMSRRRARCCKPHDLINPSFNYLPRFNKPVLSYWMVAGLYKLFGVSVGVERIGIALGALVIIGRRLRACPDRDVGCGRPGWVEPGPAAGTSRRRCGRRPGWPPIPRLVMFARRIFIDIWVSAFLALTLTCLRLERAISGATPDVADPDVSRRRARRPDQRSGGDRAAGDRLRLVSAGASRSPRDQDDDAAGSARSSSR